MKRVFFNGIILLFLAFAIFLSFSTLMPIVTLTENEPKTEFSTYRAFKHVERIGQKPHYIGSPNHSKVRNYIIDQFQKLDLQVHTQGGYVLDDFGTLTNPENIITKIEGSDPQPGSDLLVLSHYDSDPHSSFGASDDASGIAAILESLRTLKVRNYTPKNNVIVVITDAEEIGLLGARLFAEQHDWVDNVGLALNFEARGSSGPSNAILETNYGNSGLVNDLAKANPRFPMASSLMYEIYKTLPNDTDATVFREDKDIPSLFFAFIDGHYNYHSATDTPENLDINSLAHQGSYLMALLPYLGDQDLSDYNKAGNQVYFNFPFFKLLHYSYGWIFPLLIMAWLVFAVLFIWGFRTQRLNKSGIWAGVKAFLLSLGLSGGIGFFGWKVVMFFYPQYGEIQQGFPYNGHAYIGGFVLLSTALFLLIYHYFQKRNNHASLLIAPLLLWLLINTGLAIGFKGATYFIIPVFFLEIVLGLMIWRLDLNQFFRLLCSIPAIFIFAPLVLYVPVALGIKMIFAGLLLFVLFLSFLLPVLTGFKKKNLLALLAFIGGGVFFVQAHMNSGFTKEHPKPNSLVYLLDENEEMATWHTYDHILDDWTSQYVSKKKKPSQKYQVMASKYGEGFTYSGSAPMNDIPGINFIEKSKSVGNGKVLFKLYMTQERKMDRLIFFSNEIVESENLEVNGIKMNNLEGRASKIRQTSVNEANRILTYYPIDNDTLRLQFELPKNVQPALEVYGASYDLFNNPWIEVSKREDDMMPRPFVLNDAIITRQIWKP